VRRVVAQIPHGFQAGSSWIRQATVQELSGYDEQLIVSTQNFSPPIKTSLLLERVVEFTNLPPNLDLLETIRELPVGDRITLILHLRKITFGSTLYCTIQCPLCTANLSLDLSIDSLLQPANPNPQTTYPLKLDGHSLTIRPLRGSDLEDLTITQTPLPNIANLSERLLRSAILISDPALPELLSSQFQEQLSTTLSQIDSQADLTLNITCPSCNKIFQSSLDVENFFLQEATSRYPQLEREVHWIALHYHWSEKDIMSLASSKRKRYVELINASLSGESV